MKGINTPGQALDQEASPPVPPQGARYRTLRSLHSLGRVDHSLVPPHSLRLEIKTTSVQHIYNFSCRFTSIVFQNCESG